MAVGKSVENSILVIIFVVLVGYVRYVGINFPNSIVGIDSGVSLGQCDSTVCTLNGIIQGINYCHCQSHIEHGTADVAAYGRTTDYISSSKVRTVIDTIIIVVVNVVMNPKHCSIRKVVDSVAEVVMTVMIRRNRPVMLLYIGSHPVFISWRGYAVVILHGSRLAVNRRGAPVRGSPWNGTVDTCSVPTGGCG